MNKPSDALRFERHELLLLKSDIAALVWAVKQGATWDGHIAANGPTIGDILTRSHERIKQLLERVEGAR